MSESEDQFLRVGAGSNPQKVAAAIAHAIYENRTCKLRAVGAGAVNQANKAVAIARGFVAPRGIDLAMIPGFTSIDSREGQISAMVLTVVTYQSLN